MRTKQKLILMLLALFTSIGAWATPTTVTVIDKTLAATTYGSLSSTTFTTNDASGMAGVTIEGVNYADKVNDSYGYCLGCSGVSNGTVTMTAPEGYVIMSYSVTGRLNTSDFVFTLTPSAGGNAVALTTGGQTLSASGLEAQSASFTYAVTTNKTQASTNTFYMPSLTITIGTAEEAAFAKSQQEAYNIVQGWISTIQAAKGLVKNASQYTSNAKESSEGSYEGLLDGEYTTFFHSTWNNGPAEDHYLQVELADPVEDFYFYFKKRSQNNANRPTSITISGSNDGSNFTDITTINSGLPTDASVIDYTSSKISLGASYQYIRFTVTATNNAAASNGHVFFTFSEFYILPSDTETDNVMNLRAALVGTSPVNYTAQNISDVTDANTDLFNTIINVTYALYESDGTFVSNTVVEQEKNSAVSIPAAISNYTYYDYATEGTIGTEDCTIKVTRTLKAGYVISLDGLSNSKCYNIRNNRGTWAVGSGATVVNSTAELGLAFLASDTKQQFAFITYEGNVYLYSVGEGKFAYVDGTKLSLTADVTSAVAASPVTFQVSTNSTYMYSEPIIVTVNGSHFGVSTDYSPDVYKYQSQGDGGNCAYIIEAGSFDATSALAALEEYFHPSYTVTYIVKDGSDNVLFTSEPVATTNGANITTLPAEYQLTNFYTYNTVDVTISSSGNTNVEFTATPKSEPLVKYTADTSNPYYYNLNIRSQYLVYNSEATGQVTLQSTSEPFNANASWAFIGEPYAGFKVINKTKGTDYFLTYTGVVTGGNGGNNNIQFVEAADFNNRYWILDNNSNGFVLRMKEDTNIYFHHDNTNKFLRTCSVSEWSDVHNDAGSTIVASTDEEVLFTLYNTLNSYSIGDGIGQFSSNNPEITNEAAVQTINQVGPVISNKMTNAYSDAYAALLAVQNALVFNTPSAGFYRLKNVATGKYLTANALSNYSNTNKYVYANGNATSAASVIRLADGNDGMYMYNQGYGFGWVVSDKEYGAGIGYITATADKYVHWLPGNDANQIAFAICLGNAKETWASYLEKGIYTADSDESVIGATDYTADAAQWVVEEATSVTVPLNSVNGKSYATFCAPFACIPVDATAYTLTLNGSKTGLTMSEGLSTIPAGTPVLLVGTTATATLNIVNNTDEYQATPLTSSDLTGTYFAKAVTKAETGSTDFFLGVADSKVGFYHWAGSTLAANRAYFEASKLDGSNVKGFELILDDEATGISAIENEKSEAEGFIYNLAGQRLQKMQKGINIVNGKKVMVK